MPGINGLDTARRWRQVEQRNNNTVKTSIIFITAHPGYMQQAFDVNAFHYLIKPVEENRFHTVLERALAERRQMADYAGRFLMMKAGGVSQRVYLRDIRYVDCYSKRIILHTTNGDLTFYDTMDDIETQLGGSFFRPHRSVIVNLSMVEEYDATSIRLINGESLPLAKVKYRGFMKAFLHYVKTGGGDE